ncbi:LPS export ABC transporter permease LptF [Granulicella sp. S190]|uniref:LPS export ABC transporter permease LptF n=1 Tax=Granulicella sp. S190 TaxID=1747226 RepID=UPI00131BF684|nr:LPS export ABC transporter permease LptF [Granulicella sp. S190]
MRIITRYILREVTSHALLGGALFTFIIFMRDLGRILEFVVRDSATLGDVIRIIAFTLPPALTVTIPMAVLVGILLGLSRLAADSEITAMRASGMGAIDFVRIVSIVSAVALALGLFNSLYLAPRAATGLIALGESLKSSQASFEVQPRVFYEEFKDRVLYIQDVSPAAGAALWHHVFLADLTEPADPHITTADQAVVVNGTPNSSDAQTIRLHLINGGQHDTSSTDPNQYNISTFNSTDVPIETEAPEDAHLGRVNTPIQALSLPELWRRAKAVQATSGHESSVYRIEFNKRFSYPFACLVLMLVGVPLGISSKRGGKSTGFVLTILLVFIYYFLSSVGVAFAQSGKLSPFLGVWGANLLFAAAGAILLYQMSRGGIALSLVSTIGVWLSKLITRLTSNGHESASTRSNYDVATLLRRFRSIIRIQFPLLLDDYVMREYATNFAIVLSSFSTLFLIFTFFELIGAIFKNRTPLVTVGEYLVTLIPYILYNITPLCALVAVLVTFGSLSRTSELTAMKSSGISLYRIITPVLVVTILISVGLFAFDELYLPAANRRQEALLSIIKDKPTQTFSRPDRQWISGQTNNAGEPSRIFYYQYFNAEKDTFANLTVFEFDPASFTLQRRIFAATAQWDPKVNNWVFDNGWQRTFSGETIASYQPFTVATFPEIREQPGYFKKEYIPSQEMSYTELSHYIDDLKQSGFDTKRLSVQLNKKIAYPLITLVMAILAIPFALSMGKKGSLTGIATAIGLAITYWVVALIFESLGNVNTLPAVLAAWTPDLLFGITGAYLLLRTPT